jgi:hypothetical protein
MAQSRKPTDAQSNQAAKPEPEEDKKIELSVVNGQITYLKATVRGESFNDSFTDGPKWRDTFADGGKWLSNFNNLGQGGLSLRHKATQLALDAIKASIVAAESKPDDKKP